jgi:hypothetical protein
VSCPADIFDIANSYKGPVETDIDLWVGYDRKLGDKVAGCVQLDVRSIGEGNDLIPITTQPSGVGPVCDRLIARRRGQSETGPTRAPLPFLGDAQ